MCKVFNANITWLLKEKGGRQTGIPLGDKYAPIIRITKPVLKPLPWLDTDDTWSLFVENKEFISDYETVAVIRYLSDKAPDNLEKDVEFELYEGNKLVAGGIIL